MLFETQDRQQQKQKQKHACMHRHMGCMHGRDSDLQAATFSLSRSMCTGHRQ